MRANVNSDRALLEIQQAIRQEEINKRRARPDAEKVNEESTRFCDELLRNTPCQRCGGVAEEFWIFGSGKQENEGRKVNYVHFIYDGCYDTHYVKSYFSHRAIMCGECGPVLYGKGGLYQTNKRAGILCSEAKMSKNPHVAARAWRECLEVRKVLAVMCRRDMEGTNTLSTLHLPVELWPEWFVPKTAQEKKQITRPLEDTSFDEE